MENENYQIPDLGSEPTTPNETPVQALAKKALPKKYLLIGGIAVVAIIALILIISLFKGPNKATTPLDLDMAVKNAKSYKAYEKAQLNLSNNLAENEMEDLLKLLKKTDEYDEEELKEDFEEGVEELEDKYGKNYKFYYKIVDKDKLSEHTLLNAADDLTDAARKMYDQIKETDMDDLEDMAESMDLKKSDAKKLKSILEGFYKKMKKAKVTAGYELEVTYYVKGSELDEPKELSKDTIKVYKVNGRWVSLDNLDISMF